MGAPKRTNAVCSFLSVWLSSDTHAHACLSVYLSVWGPALPQSTGFTRDACFTVCCRQKRGSAIKASEAEDEEEDKFWSLSTQGQKHSWKKITEKPGQRIRWTGSGTLRPMRDKEVNDWIKEKKGRARLQTCRQHGSQGVGGLIPGPSGLVQTRPCVCPLVLLLCSIQLSFYVFHFPSPTHTRSIRTD